MDQYRVVLSGGKEYGPIDLAGMQQWIREGRVLKTTRVRKNDGEVVVAETLPELAEIFNPQPGAASSPPIALAVALPTEFRSWDFIGRAWEIVKPHWLPLGLMCFILAVMTGIPYIGACISIVLHSTIMVGIYRAILGMLAGQTPSVEMMFSGFDRFGQAFLAGLVISILVSVGLVFLIVPGIILAIMWMFTSLVIAETEQDFWTAMKTSVDLTRGYRWELFCLALACIPVALLGLLVCCIGVVVAQAVCMTAVALAYRFLQAKQGRPAIA